MKNKNKEQLHKKLQKDVSDFYKRYSPINSFSETTLLQFILKEVKIGQKEILTEAIELFSPHKEQPMTGNVVNLELKGLRGDYE